MTQINADEFFKYLKKQRGVEHTEAESISNHLDGFLKSQTAPLSREQFLAECKKLVCKIGGGVITLDFVSLKAMDNNVWILAESIKENGNYSKYISFRQALTIIQALKGVE